MFLKKLIDTFEKNFLPGNLALLFEVLIVCLSVVIPPWVHGCCLLLEANQGQPGWDLLGNSESHYEYQVLQAQKQRRGQILKIFILVITRPQDLLFQCLLL